uniref:DNA-directed primase/polymerase protein n=1 Tax=Setaria digitata TaxID=48799 RepID=A0A915PHG6_9BILA
MVIYVISDLHVYYVSVNCSLLQQKKAMNELKRLNSMDDGENWFYGIHDRGGRIENAVHVILSKPQKAKRSLFEDSLGCFAVYKRQNDALMKCKQEGPTSRVFAFEHSISHPGRRRFLVSTVKRFWQWYKKQSNVSFYELILQNHPTNLYFDLEFYRETNPDIEEKSLLRDFNDCVTEMFMNMFGLNLNPEKEMLILDASSTTKFSEHIIIHLTDNYFFPSNTSMKSFIQKLKEKMFSSGRCLVWNADATEMVTLFDAAVYSANRNFRLYLSSKLGKNNPLVLSERCNFYAVRKHVSRQQIFLDSLVIPAKYNSIKNILYIPVDKDRVYSDAQTTDISVSMQAVANSSGSLSNERVNCMIGCGATSPFPILDQHIIAINRQWKNNASIRQWKLFIDRYTMSRHITYYILHCRFCFNIGREHRSNGVYWIVDLDKLHCFQKCFDVDCHDRILEISKDALNMPDTNVGDKKIKRNNVSKQLLMDLVKEARAMNEVEIQKCTRSIAPQMKALDCGRNLFELTDDELLSAFIEIKN